MEEKNQTHQQDTLQQEKLKAEIDLLRATIEGKREKLNPREAEHRGNEIELLKFQLEKERKDSGKKSRMIRILEFIAKWNSTIISLPVFIGSLIAVIGPLNSFIKQNKSALEVNLNKEMIELVTNSKDAKSRERAIVLLGYYKQDAIPILLFFIENEATLSDSTNDRQAQHVINTIITIVRRNKLSPQLMLNSFDSFVDEILRSVNPETKQFGYNNYMDLFMSLKLTREDKMDVLRHLKDAHTQFEVANLQIDFKGITLLCIDAFEKEGGSR